MTTSPPPPSSDTIPASTVWTRPKITVYLLTLAVFPFLAGAVNAAFLSGPRGFWPAAGYMFAAEFVACSGFMLAVMSVPALRSRFDIPDPDGDERERWISGKATRFAFLATGVILLAVSLGSQVVATAIGGHPARIPADWLIFILLAGQFAQFWSMIYYSRKM